AHRAAADPGGSARGRSSNVYGREVRAQPSSFLIFLASAGASGTSPVRRRVRLVGLCSRRWFLLARRRMILPEPVTRKRLPAPLCDLFFGISPSSPRRRAHLGRASVLLVFGAMAPGRRAAARRTVLARALAWGPVSPGRSAAPRGGPGRPRPRRGPRPCAR